MLRMAIPWWLSVCVDRIRFCAMLVRLELAGFDCWLPRNACREQLPIARTAPAEPFRKLPDDDLPVNGFDIVIRRKA